MADNPVPENHFVAKRNCLGVCQKALCSFGERDKNLHECCCIQCIMSDSIFMNSISQVDDHTHGLVLKQLSWIILSVNVNNPWFDNKGLQVIEEIKKASIIYAVGLVISGILAVVVMVTTTAVVSVTFC